MKKLEYSSLIETIDEEKKKIKEHKIETPIPFVKDSFDQFKDFYINQLDILKAGCLKADHSLFDYGDNLKAEVWQTVHSLTRHHEEICSNQIPSNLYFLLKDFMEDFKIDNPIYLKLGNYFLLKPLEAYFTRGDFIQMVDPDLYQASIQKNREVYQVIELPRSEIDNPLSYSLIIHECIHSAKICENLINNITSIFHEDIPYNEWEEIIVDLISVRYMGPVYALLISRMPEKIGVHKDINHPSLLTRLWYFKNYLNQINDKYVKSGKKEDIVIRTHNNIIKEIETKYLKLLEKETKEDKRASESIVKIIKKIELSIQELFKKNKIPFYENELEKLKLYLGVGDMQSQMLSEKISKWLLDRTDGREIFLPVKPLLFLNFLILIEGYNDKRRTITNVSLDSFKKWYVRKPYLEPKLV